MFLWRVSNHTTLNGRGGLLASARWHSEGRPVVYLAETPAGALLEVLVHLELDPDFLPSSYKLLKAEAPDNISQHRVSVADLTPDWLTNVVATRTVGDEWLASQRTALLLVPSAIVPETWNTLLNPQHPDAKRIKVLWHHSYPWDARLFK